MKKAALLEQSVKSNGINQGMIDLGGIFAQ